MRKQLTTLALTIGLLLTGALPASAADELGVSRDGVTFSSSLSGSLFDSAFIWVPGDVESETFYIRNQGADTARLTVDILDNQVSELIESGDLHVTASSGSQTETVSDAAEHRLLTMPNVEPDEIVPVTITVAFDETSTNETQLLSSDLTFRINLKQTSAVLGESDDELLPDTGAQTPLWLAAFAALCIASGAALISRRRTHTKGASNG